MTRPKLAIVGCGIAGLTTAHYLQPYAELTLFEANDYAGGHTHTHQLQHNQQHVAVDSGFIVFNEENYPNFTQLLNELKVSSQPTTMSFSVSCEQSGLEYNGTNLNGLFAQRRNLFRPAFYGLLRDIGRFNRAAIHWLETPNPNLTLGDFLQQNGFQGLLLSHYLLPMGAAIWSSQAQQMLQFPAQFFLQFLNNHRLLHVTNRPQWRVIKGGSQRYVESLLKPLQKQLQLNCPVEQVERQPDGVWVHSAQGSERFDRVIMATHSDTSLMLLKDADTQEQQRLQAIPYEKNQVTLHHDKNLMPRYSRAWAAWNYRLSERQQDLLVTYDMNRLQGLATKQRFFVSLNAHHRIAEQHIVKTMTYAHPQFNQHTLTSQQAIKAHQGHRQTYFCGAWCGYGFHEDGVNSGLEVVKTLKRDYGWV